MKRTVFLSLLVLSTSVLCAQRFANDTVSPWTLGIGAGYYIADDSPNEFYSGRDNGRLNTLFQTSTQNYMTILNDLGGYPFSLASGPSDIIYKNSGSFELFVGYALKNNWSINVNFHTVRLDVSGVFTLLVDRVSQVGNPEPFLELSEIKGRERRSHLIISVGKQYDLGDNFYLMADVGMDFNFIEVLSNEATIASRDYNILFFNLSQQISNTTTAGTGLCLGTRLGYQLTGGYGFHVKASYCYSLIDVNNVSEATSHIFIPGIGFTKQF